MHTFLRAIFLGIFIFANFLAYAKNISAQDNCETSAAQQHSPEGYWQIIDDETNKPRAIIHICAVNHGALFFGEIIQANYNQGESAEDRCSKCGLQDWRHNQLNLGLVILTDMKTDPNNPLKLQGGKILDPKNGKIYDATITQRNNGQTIEARGYLLFTLLGRSQTWQRIQPKQLESLLGAPLKDQDDNQVYFKTTLGKYVANDYLSCKEMEKKLQSVMN